MKKNYIIITNKWLKKATPYSHEVENAKYVVKNNKRYYVNKVNKIINTNNKVKVALWLEEVFGGVIKYLPDIKEDNIQCADYYFKKEHWKLKEISGNSKNTIWHSIKNSKKQANNFILDVTKSKLTNNEIYHQINKIFESEHAMWINIIIIKRNMKLIGVLKNKKYMSIKNM